MFLTMSLIYVTMNLIRIAESGVRDDVFRRLQG